MSNEPYDLIGASVSVADPSADDYAELAEEWGMDPQEVLWAVGIGADYPDVVLTASSREQLVAVAKDLLLALDA